MKKLINKIYLRGILSTISLFLVSSTIITLTGCNDGYKLNEKKAIMIIAPQTVLNGTVPDQTN